MGCQNCPELPVPEGPEAPAQKPLPKPPEDIIRVLRVIEYIGPRKWVETTVAASIHGTKLVGAGQEIHASTIGAFPKIIKQGGTDVQ